jgi:hypothetical protein
MSCRTGPAFALGFPSPWVPVPLRVLSRFWGFLSRFGCCPAPGGFCPASAGPVPLCGPDAQRRLKLCAQAPRWHERPSRGSAVGTCGALGTLDDISGALVPLDMSLERRLCHRWPGYGFTAVRCPVCASRSTTGWLRVRSVPGLRFAPAALCSVRPSRPAARHPPPRGPLPRPPAGPAATCRSVLGSHFTPGGPPPGDPLSRP